KKYNIAYSTTDNNIILTDEDINAIVVTTPHNTHAGIVIAGLKNNKHVFVEKPLALTNNEIDSIIQAKKVSEKTVFVGFNRRFSP
ncbi:Gfo/Idh/MocA family oxidoreductase, partial [Acinetobacter baumannii]